MEATADALSSSVIKWERPGVAVYPGLNTLTRMSRPFRSTIQVRANERIAAFDASYTEQAAKPLIDTIEPVRITEEPLPSSGSGFVDPGIHRQHVNAPGLRFDGCV